MFKILSTIFYLNTKILLGMNRIKEIIAYKTPDTILDAVINFYNV